MPDYYTPQEVAKLLQISVHTLASWRRIPARDGPPWIEVGGVMRYPRAELEAWLAGRMKNGAAA